MESKKNLLKLTLLIGDIILVYLALFLTLAIRHGDFSFWPGPQTQLFLFYFSIEITTKEKDLRYLFLIPIVFVCRHIGYGLGSIWGLVTLSKVKK
ncbi:MAG: hypothetical protein DDT30_01882 [Dehalococcoidia bacterium]|nr:hypothetical protein [Bacillota bacterium]